MKRHPILHTLLAGVSLVAAWCVARPALGQDLPAGGADRAACDAAGQVAEAQYAVPPGLLRAIGRVESGRRDPSTGRVAAWPWTINAAGQGHVFASAAEALAATRALQATGVASIDVGCFQVNLMHHPLAFPMLEDGFDPSRNADYAARFLSSLRLRTGSWDAAVAAYHSGTPELGGPYRDRVMAGLAHDGSDGHGMPASAAAVLVPAAPVERVVTWAAPAAGGAPVTMHIWTPSAVGQAASIVRITRG
jgi:hypothetical protein